MFEDEHVEMKFKIDRKNLPYDAMVADPAVLIPVDDYGNKIYQPAKPEMPARYATSLSKETYDRVYDMSNAVHYIMGETADCPPLHEASRSILQTVRAWLALYADITEDEK